MGGPRLSPPLCIVHWRRGWDSLLDTPPRISNLAIFHHSGYVRNAANAPISHVVHTQGNGRPEDRPILAEIEDVLVRPEVRRKLRMTPVEAAALIELLRRQGLGVTRAIRIARSRDPGDDKFFECAAAGGADYIVSAALLSLGEVEGIPIIDADALQFPHGNEKEAVASPRIWSLGTVPPASAPVVTAATKKT